MTRYWTCRTCRERLPRIKRKCKCGAARPASRRPKHTEALKLPYEFYVELNGGEFCGICDKLPSARRKLDRDHCHKGDGYARGLLCGRCNRAIPNWMTAEWLDLAAAYLRKTEQA
jgi:hypothetical protein